MQHYADKIQNYIWSKNNNKSYCHKCKPYDSLQCYLLFIFNKEAETMLDTVSDVKELKKTDMWLIISGLEEEMDGLTFANENLK